MPQGSILGPLLFLLYINDLPTGLHTHTRLYADDSSLYLDYTKEDTYEASQALQQDINRIEEWVAKWLITFNATKTESLLFSRKREKNTPALTMMNTRVEEVVDHKHLGIVLQQDAKWKNHILEITTKAKKKVDILRSLMHRLNRKSLEKLYLSYVRPCLEYGSTIWDNCTDYQKEELEKIQLAALRVITGAKKGTSHALLYSETGIERLQARRDRRKLSTMFKIQKKTAPQTLIESMPTEIVSKAKRSLRTHTNTTLPKANAEYHLQSFIPSTIREWNKLPVDVRNIPNLQQFKEQITPIKVKIPNYIYAGERNEQIIHTRMRLKTQ